jgi:beta-galactosidase
LIGQRKPQNHYRRAIYGLTPVELLVERPAPPNQEQTKARWGYYDELESWTWDVAAGTNMTVHIYTPGDSVQLLLNGSTPTTDTVLVPDQCKVTCTVPYAAGELTAIASKNGQEIGRKTLRTTGAPAALRLAPEITSLTTSRDELAYVLVEVLDSHGQLVPDAVLRVDFAVSGAGSLLACGNGNPHNVDSFQLPRHWTFHGRAMAILRPAQEPGVLTLTASAKGLASASLTLPVELARTSTGTPAQRGQSHRAQARRPARLRDRPATALASVGPGPALVSGLVMAIVQRRLRRSAEER